MKVFVYSGIGSQWCGMCASLYENNPIFKETVDLIDNKLSNFTRYSLKKILTDSSDKRILQPEIAHPAIFTTQIALSKSLIARNIIPEAIIGHSAGELAGSVIAKVLTIDDAVKVLVAHSRLIAKSTNKGNMLFAACNTEDIKKINPDIEFAAINSVNSCVITGKSEILSSIESHLKKKNIFNKKLNINVPFHSDIIEKHLTEFYSFIENIKPNKPQTPFYSSLTGKILDIPMDATYWATHIRNTVNFSKAINALIANKAKAFIEISPHPHLTISIKENIFYNKSNAVVMPTMQKNESNENIFYALQQKLCLDDKITSESNFMAAKEKLSNDLKKAIEKIMNKKRDNFENASFFEMGLTSINIIKLSEQFNLSPVVFFKNPTINSLIENLYSSKKETEDRVSVTKSDLNVENIAVIGMACRFPPDSNSPEKFLEFLKKGNSAISPPPENRRQWLSDKYKAGYLENNIWEFDNSFFNIPAMEAIYLDPQQRLLLETSIEAIENALTDFNEIHKKKTGVFVGISTDDYKNITFYNKEPNGYAGTGNLFSTASGRLSYFLNLKGPAISIDTACSSSLVATHYAVKSLQNKDIDIAIVAGVNIILLPILFDYFEHVGALSPSFKCKTFDKSADGYARGEGCGVVILKRLTDAEKDGNSIDAVIRSSCCNQDGKTAVLTAPSGNAQASLIRNALQYADLSPSDIDFIETHGTGTQLGDSVEVNALGEVFKNKNKKIYLGALKTLTGHLEAASGIASLIKTILLLKNNIITPNDNFSSPNKFIDFDKLNFSLPSKVVEIKNETPIRAGVSSFGYSGTNAHIILEQYLEKRGHNLNIDNLPYNFSPVSAKTEKSLKKLLIKYKNFINNIPDHLLASMSYSQAICRNHYKYKVGIVFKNKEEFIEKTDYLLSQNFTDKKPENPKICFLFPGQGVQYNNMCKELYDTFEEYRKPFDTCNEIIKKTADFDIRQLLFASKENKKIHETLYTHPIVFSCSYALSEMWKSWGIYPDALIGQSFGEYAVLPVAGILSLENAVKFILKRGELMHALPPNGKMMTVIGERTEAEKLIQHLKNITVALISSNNNFVLTGDDKEIEQAATILTKHNMVATILNISIASHCNLMRPVAKALKKFGEQLEFKTSTVPIYNNISGNEKYDLPPEYFSEQMLSCVQFSKCIRNAMNNGVNTFMEMGPTSALSNIVRENTENKKISFLQSASKRKNSIQVIFESLKNLYERGAKIKWEVIYKNLNLKKIRLPVYPFDRKLFIYKSKSNYFNKNKETDSPTKPAKSLKQLMIKLFEANIGRNLTEKDFDKTFGELGIDKLTLYSIIKNFEHQTEIKFNKKIKKISLLKDLINLTIQRDGGTA